MKTPVLFETEQYIAGDPNPCVGLFGKGPAGKKCKTCVHIRRYGEGHSKRWFKCLLRRDPRDAGRLGGPSTDHRARWNACGKYAEEELY